MRKLTEVDKMRIEQINQYLYRDLSIAVLLNLKEKVDKLIKHKMNKVAKAKMKGVLYASFIDPKTNKRKFGKLPQMEHDRKLCGETPCLYNSDSKGHTLYYFVDWSDLTPCDEKGK
jgi:hypothetical protein